MKLFCRYALFCFVLVPTACTEHAANVGTSAIPSAPLRTATHRSWMLPEAKDEDLVYVSDAYNNVVDVYDYGRSRQVGTLTGFKSPSGQCVDKEGDVWVTEYAGDQVFEFAHGRSKPLEVLSTNGSGEGCSVDPKTGALAVGNAQSNPSVGGAADIQVFQVGSTTPIDYYSGSGSEDCDDIQAPGYDDHGNLYFEAYWGNSGLGMCELPGNRTRFFQVPVARTSKFAGIDHPGSVMWDGKQITFEDYRNESSQDSIIYQAVRKGAKLEVVGSTTLAAACRYANITQPFIAGEKNTPSNHREATVVVGGAEGCDSLFGYWHYPAGGVPFRQKVGPEQVGGASVSLAVK